MTFERYHNDRLIKKNPMGFFVIKPIDHDDNGMKLYCDVCKQMFRTSDDEAAWHQFKCCHYCSMKWAARDRENWLAGWRPSDDEIETEVASRPTIIVNVNVDAFNNT